MNFESLLNSFIEEAHARGLHWARSSASLVLTQSDRQVLEDIARALAQRAACTQFDPATNMEDKYAEEEHTKTIGDLADAEMAAVKASHVVRQREDERARLGANPLPPCLPPWMTIGGTTLFAMAFGIGIFDWIHDRLPDVYLAALAALIPSVALGVFVVRSLTSAESPAERKLGFIAGIGLAAATGVLRFAFAPDEWLIAVALTLLETAVVLFLHWHGDALQVRFRQWLAQQEGRAAAQGLLDAANAQHRRAIERVAALTEKSYAFLQEVARRSLLCQKAAEIQTVVVNAILAGAQLGVAENQGLRRGVSPAAFRQAVQ